MPARRTFPTTPGSTLTTRATPGPLSGGTDYILSHRWDDGPDRTYLFSVTDLHLVDEPSSATAVAWVGGLAADCPSFARLSVSPPLFLSRPLTRVPVQTFVQGVGGGALGGPRNLEVLPGKGHQRKRDTGCLRSRAPYPERCLPKRTRWLYQGGDLHRFSPEVCPPTSEATTCCLPSYRDRTPVMTER